MNVWVRWHTFFLSWTQKRLNERQFLILSSAMIGLTAGLAAIVLKTFVHYIHDALTDNRTFISQYYLYPFFPLIGLILVVAYVNRFHKGSLERGTSFIQYSISRKSSLLAPLTPSGDYPRV